MYFFLIILFIIYVRIYICTLYMYMSPLQIILLIMFFGVYIIGP